MEQKKDMTNFSVNLDKMIATSEATYRNNNYVPERTYRKNYTKEEIKNILESGSLFEKITLSRNYFGKDGVYRRIIMHYATLLKYSGILIPNPVYGQKLSNSSIQKRYNNALGFTDIMNIPINFTNWSMKVLRDGAYYGVVSKIDKKHFAFLDLPVKYCRSRFKDTLGNHVIEFNVQYFDTIVDEDSKNAALAAYPPEVSAYYKVWSSSANKSVVNSWCLIPTSVGICFQLFDDACPALLNVIPAAIDYDEAVETERERDLEEIRKIIVQQIPHLSDGGLLFEPNEAAEMHRGAVGMMKGNKNISVLTTYADVEGIVSKTSSDSARSSLEKMEQNIYYESGTSGQLFASNSNLALSTSIKNDMALMLVLTRQYDVFITSVINNIYANGNVSFKYTTLPVTWYNDEEYIDMAFKLASSGYSFIVPMIALGFSQKDLTNLKDLENDVLNLREKLIPLTTSYTQSGDGEGEAGAPEKKPEDKAKKTIQNTESLDHGGSN